MIIFNFILINQWKQSGGHVRANKWFSNFSFKTEKQKYIFTWAETYSDTYQNGKVPVVLIWFQYPTLPVIETCTLFSW